jgi:hypothetical protein
MRDKIIYFPSVIKEIMNYNLMEEAEKYYFEEEDEFPMEYSAALRAIASVEMEGQEDVDEEYMESLSQDVDIDG